MPGAMVVLPEKLLATVEMVTFGEPSMVRVTGTFTEIPPAVTITVAVYTPEPRPEADACKVSGPDPVALGSVNQLVVGLLGAMAAVQLVAPARVTFAESGEAA